MDPVYYAYLDAPIGPFLVAGDGRRVVMTSFSTGRQQRRPEPGWIKDPDPIEPILGQLEDYFAGQRTEFDVELEVTGTPFQLAAWRALRTIPFGETRSYGDVARALGEPGASRAVGAANAANRLPILIPCHRVIGADGTLTGFGGGLDTKRWLLDFEGALPPEQETLF